MPLHAGLDWDATGHAVCIVDERGTVLARFDCPQTAAGLADLVARLKRLGSPAELAVAIERPSGLLVETLAAAGRPVMPIHPNVVKACRPRYRAAGGKSDPGDAHMLADIPRTDGHRFRPLAPPAFITRYPTPDSASRLGEKRLASFMASHAYCGRRSPAELPDGQIVMSFPRAERINAAQILAELRERFQTEQHLAAEAGICPVTHASGRSHGVVFRFACNHRLRAAITC